MTDEKTPRKRRSAQEILAERKAQVAAAEQRAALEIAREQPLAQMVLQQIDEVGKNLTLARRGFVKGRQNFENRIASHEAWISEIKAERDAANANIALYEEEKQNLQEVLSAVLESLGDNMDSLGEDTIQDMISNASLEAFELYGEQARNHALNYESAQNSRKAFTESLKPKKKKEEDPPTREQEAGA